MSQRRASVFMVTPLRLLSQSVFDYEYGVVTDGEKVRVICTEGVSWEVRDDKPWALEYPKNKPGLFIGREEIISLVNKSEETPVPLDKWIRTFGARLETNFHLCEQWIAENMFNASCDICREMRMPCDTHVTDSVRSI